MKKDLQEKNSDHPAGTSATHPLPMKKPMLAKSTFLIWLIPGLIGFLKTK
jgi:hypothetical protein